MLVFYSVFVCSRLGVIEEEREEDERRLNVALAAAERMNVLVRRTKTHISARDQQVTWEELSQCF